MGYHTLLGTQRMLARNERDRAQIDDDALAASVASDKMVRLQRVQMQIAEIVGRYAGSGDATMDTYFGWESEYEAPDSDEEQEQEENVDGDAPTDEWL